MDRSGMISGMEHPFETAARRLADARRDRAQIERLPEAARPTTTEEALRIQRRAFELLGEPLGGWKCSVPTGNNMIVAPMPSSTIRRSSPCPVIPHEGRAQIEPEIAFYLRYDLDPRATPYSEEEVREAVFEARLVLELMASRYMDHSAITFFEGLADSMRHQGMFVGPVLESPFERPLESFHLTIDGVFDKEVRHPNGHPLKPLHWLANFLSGRGETLRAGKLITTGSYAGIIEVPMGVPLKFTYGDLGGFTAEFRAE